MRRVCWWRGEEGMVVEGEEGMVGVRRVCCWRVRRVCWWRGEEGMLVEG